MSKRTMAIGRCLGGAGRARPVALEHKNAWLNWGSSVSKLRKDCVWRGFPDLRPSHSLICRLLGVPILHLLFLAGGVSCETYRSLSNPGPSLPLPHPEAGTFPSLFECVNYYALPCKTI